MSLKKLPSEVSLTVNDLKILLVNYRDIENLRGLNGNLDEAINEIEQYYNQKFLQISPTWAENPTHLVNELFAENDTNAIKYLLNNFPYTQIIAEAAVSHSDLSLLTYVLNYGVDLNMEQLLNYAKDVGNEEAIDKISEMIREDE